MAAVEPLSEGKWKGGDLPVALIRGDIDATAARIGAVVQDWWEDGWGKMLAFLGRHLTKT